MSQRVLIVDNKTIEKMKEFYQDDLVSKLPPGAILAAKPLNCSVTAYKSGKVLFQGARHEEEAAIWEAFTSSSQVTPKAKSPVIKKEPVNQPTFRNMSLIGSDEVGTGDYFGPITVVAAFVAKNNFARLTELGVKDSKGMKDDQIIKIAKQLIKEIPYSLLVLPNEKYNSLQAKGMNQGKMKAILHNQAILHLKKKLTSDYDGILIDQFVERGIYFRYISEQKEKVQEPNMFFQTKAESLHLSVAAASIIARYAFVKEMDKLSESAGFEIPKGAGSHVDVAAAKLIQTHGVEALGDYCKVHFANTEKAKKLLKL